MSTDRDVLRSRSHFDTALVVIEIKNGESSPGPQSSDPSSLIANRLDRLPGKFDISRTTLHMYDLAHTTCIAKNLSESSRIIVHLWNCTISSIDKPPNSRIYATVQPNTQPTPHVYYS
jgi:hypothetical protein